MSFPAIVLMVGFIAGAIASVSGFGIGSILTPLLALNVGTRLAVAAVSIPHFVATALRCWLGRRHVDRKVLLSFGIMSAAGGLAGAVLHQMVSSPALTIVFALVIMFAGFIGMTGLNDRMHFGSVSAWVAGGISGALGGLVGNQGGIRAAALLGFGLEKQSFVATATAIALFVDGARMPVYFSSGAADLFKIYPLIAAATVGVVLGTFAGMHFLKNVPAQHFRRIVSALIFILGLFMLLNRQD